MKHFVYLLAFAFMNTPVNAQSIETGRKENEVLHLQALIQESTLFINWESRSMKEDDYWEVQGSVDGKEFLAIGFVMGADPRGLVNSYRYKQAISKVKPGMKYFRVLHIENASVAFASSSVRLKND
jgi:hypothetical protein